MDDFCFTEAIEVTVTDFEELITEEGDGEKNMICRAFNLTLISAENLPEVRKVFDSRVYAKITIGGHKSTEQVIKADGKNGLNPFWNCIVKYNLFDYSVMQEGHSVVVKLYSERTLGDRYVGEVNMSLKWLFDHWSSSGSMTIAFPVAGAGSGAVLNVSCSFGERIQVKKPALWKKVLVTGATVLFKLTLLAATGSTG